ncbi:MAG: hypothetical protein K6B54_08225 [Clostridia bacterium]|nr:hypothetical protein [Clostridia bacterium]
MNKTVIIKRITVFVSVLLTLLILCGCSLSSFTDGFTSISSVNSNSSKDRVIRSKTFPQNLPSAQDYKSGTFENILIVDVSSWTGDIDFNTAKENGVSGVIIRIARYNLSIDKKFLDNYNSAKAAGIPVGCYYFSGASTVEDAVKEAETVYNLIKELNLTFELPVFFDVEDDGSNNIESVSRQTLTDIIDAFCGSLCHNGILSGYYASHSFADHNIYSSQLRDYPFWIAEWTYEITSPMYKNVFLWQYTSELEVSGMQEKCDGNRLVRDLLSYTKEYYEAYEKLSGNVE